MADECGMANISYTPVKFVLARSQGNKPPKG